MSEEHSLRNALMETGAAPQHDPQEDTCMNNTRKVTPLKGKNDFIKEGVCTFTPARANAVFRQCRYERNRNENSAKAHINALRREMEMGDWLPKQQIDFARLPDGKLILVNGHHRMVAQAESGVDIEWNVVIHDCADMEEVAGLFWRYDTVLRKRSMNNILDGVSASERLGLSKSAAKGLSSAAPFIDNGLRPPRAGTRIYTPSERLGLMGDWAHETAVYDGCAAAADSKMRRKLFGAQVMAVALLTIRADEKSAREFWHGLAADDGLRKGDPRKTLSDFLRDTHAASTGLTATSVAVARAWNAWVAGKQLSMIRVGRASVKVAGTSMVAQP